MGDQCANIAKLVQLSESEAPPRLATIEHGAARALTGVQPKEALVTRHLALAEDLVGLDRRSTA